MQAEAIPGFTIRVGFFGLCQPDQHEVRHRVEFLAHVAPAATAAVPRMYAFLMIALAHAFMLT
ncbi:hypothetical protein [Mycobacterium sp. IDR2000157661]|uniref:hypothetical protein n=1 Tax=Mycobacterium sp. IDR2000157661 TaxID=2867005 RepID=UPI001EEB0F4F|nr:hypothetical protein [Mycobacterium sp. IDR2000157661]ULE32084.1 hypothetical protein K3G64_18235 [Mycobacterium sp. IDR2000157661]